MKENYTATNYPSKNIQTETYEDGDIFVTKHYYDTKDAYVKELIYEQDGTKEVKHFTTSGVATKLEHFVGDKREGLETKYIVSKADGSIKSTKMYESGKLHGDNITYNSHRKIIKHEVYALGKLIVRYTRENSDDNDISEIEIIDKDNLDSLAKADFEKLQVSLENIKKD